MSRERISLGKRGEEIAVAYLRAKGFSIEARNYRQKVGEIDIICRDGETYVFVEVKTRNNLAFGHPLEAVTFRKQRQITQAALDYLSRNRLLEERVRFDVVGVICNGPEPEITYVAGAFEMD